jgi:hypothetical protein
MSEAAKPQPKTEAVLVGPRGAAIEARLAKKSAK